MVLSESGIESRIDDFNSEYLAKHGSVEEAEKQILQRSFLSLFPKGRIKALLIDDYAEGRKTKNNFSYWVEFKTDSIGSIHGVLKGVQVFGVWYDHGGHIRFTKRYGHSWSTAFVTVKNHIHDLIESGGSKDLDAIEANPLAELFKGKILSLYYPEDYICAYSPDHIDYFMKELDISTSKKKGLYFRKEALVIWLRTSKIAIRKGINTWPLYTFGEFLYREIDPRIEVKRRMLREAGIDPDEVDADKAIQGESEADNRTWLSSYHPGGLLLEEVGGRRYKRDTVVIARLKRLRGFECQICHGSVTMKDGQKYVEGAHIKPKHEKGSEAPSNILILCPNHHKEFDLGDKKNVSHNGSLLSFELNGKSYQINMSL